LKNHPVKLLIVIQHRLELWNVPAWFPEKLQANFPDVEITNRNNYHGIEQDLRDAEVVFAFLSARNNSPRLDPCAGCTRLPLRCISCCLQSW
jgi:hypothetical protein